MDKDDSFARDVAVDIMLAPQNTLQDTYSF